MSFKYISIAEMDKERAEATQYMRKLLEDVNSDKPYSEKKYLREYWENKKKENYQNKCSENYASGHNFFSNYSSSNNVCITGLPHSNYYGYSTPSLF
jgi:hypothetical protein